MTDWSIAPVIDWLMHKGRLMDSPKDVVEQICLRVREAGMPIDRVGFFFWTLHPQYWGNAMFWDGATIDLRRAGPELRQQDTYRNSPVARIIEGERVMRRRIERADCPIDYPVLEELKGLGATDWVLCEVVFSTGQRNAVSLATRRPGGFSDRDIAEIEKLLHPFALVMENFTNRELARTLLETYLGRQSGLRVLDGKIQRGDGDEIDAVIWFSDLRESTPLSEALGERAFLELLNDYFEATAGAVLEQGGEVLRFIGDASLAVFPLPQAGARRETCERAVAAVQAARARAIAANARRAEARLPAFSFGVGLHLGRVLYGNIGTPERLEFSVIGAAANQAARIESLCKRTRTDAVASRPVAAEIGGDWPSLGRFELPGVASAMEVYAVPQG
ncbi:MAG: adenylate/guanylate cyclase domain-containing protein [Burkholderiales bacterium]|nr:adenylate/guanylate cyclase domain-containing protein [Burkholderiales bacterium]